MKFGVFLFMAIICSIGVLLSGATKIISSQQQQASTEFKAPVFGKNKRAEKAVSKKKDSVMESIKKSIEAIGRPMRYNGVEEVVALPIALPVQAQEEPLVNPGHTPPLHAIVNPVQTMFGTDDLCDGMFSDIVVNFAVERDQRYLLAQDIYLVLTAIQTVNITNDEAFVSLNRTINDSEGLLDSVDQLLLLTRRDKKDNKKMKQSLKLMRPLDSSDFNFSDEFLQAALDLNNKLKDVLEPFTDSSTNLALRPETVKHLNRVISRSLDDLTLGIPRVDLLKEKILKDIENKRNVMQMYEHQRLQVNSDTTTSSVAYIVGPLVASLGNLGAGIVAGMFGAFNIGAAIGGGAIAAPAIVLGLSGTLIGRNLDAQKISHMKSIGLQMALQEIFSEHCNLNTDSSSSNHFVDALITLGGSLDEAGQYWGDIKQISELARNGNEAEFSNALETMVRRIGMNTEDEDDSVASGESLAPVEILLVGRDKNFPIIISVEEGTGGNPENLAIGFGSDEWKIPVNQIDNVAFIQNESKHKMQEFNKCKSRPLCLSKVIPRLFSVKIHLKEDTVFPDSIPILNADHELIFTIDPSKAITRASMKLQWQNLKRFAKALVVTPGGSTDADM